MRRETDKRKKVVESGETSLLINEEKHIGDIKYKTLLAVKNLKHFFYKETNKQRRKKHQQSREQPQDYCINIW